MPLLQWHIKSTTKAQQGLYEYDAVSRLRDSQLGDDARQGHPQLHRQGRAVAGLSTAEQPVALLIDEIDKADIEFPNDLLRELDRMEFYVYETRDGRRAKHRPLVFITSNNEKELPDAFLRRCFFHYIKFPDADTMRSIVDALPRPEEGTAGRGAEDLLRGAQPAGPEEEAQHQRTARLAQAAGGRGHPARGAAEQGRQGQRAAAGRRAAEERAGRVAVREAGVHAQPLTPQTAAWMKPWSWPGRPSRWSGQVRLVPLALEHEEGLARAAADGELWNLRVTSVPGPAPRAPTSDRAARAEPATASPSRCSTPPAATVIGTSSYHDIVPAVERLEIGYTWYAASAQRSAVNTTASCC